MCTDAVLCVLLSSDGTMCAYVDCMGAMCALMAYAGAGDRHGMYRADMHGICLAGTADDMDDEPNLVLVDVTWYDKDGQRSTAEVQPAYTIDSRSVIKMMLRALMEGEVAVTPPPPPVESTVEIWWASDGKSYQGTVINTRADGGSGLVRRRGHLLGNL